MQLYPVSLDKTVSYIQTKKITTAASGKHLLLDLFGLFIDFSPSMTRVCIQWSQNTDERELQLWDGTLHYRLLSGGTEKPLPYCSVSVMWSYSCCSHVYEHNLWWKEMAENLKTSQKRFMQKPLIIGLDPFQVPGRKMIQIWSQHRLY